MDYQNAGFTILSLFPFIFILAMIVNIRMVAVLLKTGDERQKYIVVKAGHRTFIGILILLAFHILYQIAITKTQVEGINSFLLISLIALCYTINIFILKEKYGG
ncbi:MAG: hypothetical protein Q4P25_04250 [Tissierellia bacterium]|nr:hypothetical protein [Tissierellia bacterium]